MRRLAHLLVAVAVAAGPLAGCSRAGNTVGGTASETSTPAAPTPSTSPSPAGGSAGGATPVPSYAVARPGDFDGRMHTADLLVTGRDTLPPSLVARIAGVEGVASVAGMSLAATSVDGRTLTTAAVDPVEFRRFTPAATGRADFVWNRVADGEVVLDTSVDPKLVSDDGRIQLGTRENSPVVQVGAYAPLVRRAAGVGRTEPVIHAVVNTKRGQQLGLPSANGLLLSTGTFTPSALTRTLERILPDDVTMQVLALELDTNAQTAVLTGDSVSDAVGTFSYTDGPDGTVKPDPGWVREYIRTEDVPILGRVTCNKGMLPQLRSALGEVLARGLAEEIHPDEYAGCYYPRYIGRDPSNGLSLHSWGIAVDLNVPGNLRGTEGQIDRRVVAIFKKWGFAWGGDWNYTDPMHFEMNRVVRPR